MRAKETEDPKETESAIPMVGTRWPRDDDEDRVENGRGGEGGEEGGGFGERRCQGGKREKKRDRKV